MSPSTPLPLVASSFRCNSVASLKVNCRKEIIASSLNHQSSQASANKSSTSPKRTSSFYQSSRIMKPTSSKTMTSQTNLCKCKSLITILTLSTILVLLVAALIECHYHKRTQYHEQGLHGPKSYKFGYTTGDHKNPQERHEVSDGHGHVKGWYSFVDANGKHQVVHYEASKYGFRVLNHKKPYNNGKRHYNS